MLPLADENLSNRGWTSLTEQTGGVVYMAQIGGFVAGLVVGFAARGLARRSV